MNTYEVVWQIRQVITINASNEDQAIHESYKLLDLPSTSALRVTESVAISATPQDKYRSDLDPSTN